MKIKKKNECKSTSNAISRERNKLSQFFFCHQIQIRICKFSHKIYRSGLEMTTTTTRTVYKILNLERQRKSNKFKTFLMKRDNNKSAPKS